MRTGERVGTNRLSAGKSPARHGFTLLELIVSGILLGTVFALAVPTLGLIAPQRRAALQRQEAIAEVANIMERITIADWEQITTENAETVFGRLDGEIARQLPDAQLKVAVTSQPGMPEARRIHIELDWKNRAGQRSAPVRLSAWVYRRGRDE